MFASKVSVKLIKLKTVNQGWDRSGKNSVKNIRELFGIPTPCQRKISVVVYSITFYTIMIDLALIEALKNSLKGP